MQALLLLTTRNWMDDTFTYFIESCTVALRMTSLWSTLLKAVNFICPLIYSVLSLALFLLVGISSFTTSNRTKEV